MDQSTAPHPGDVRCGCLDVMRSTHTPIRHSRGLLGSFTDGSLPARFLRLRSRLCFLPRGLAPQGNNRACSMIQAKNSSIRLDADLQLKAPTSSVIALLAATVVTVWF